MATAHRRLLSGNVVFTEPATRQELDDMLKEYDMKRDSVEINHDAPQWSHNAVWNRRYMEPKTGYTLRQLWADSEPAIGQKSSASYDIKEGVEKAPCTDLRSDPTLLQNSYRTTQADAYVNHAHQTQAQSVNSQNLIKLKQYRVKRTVSPSTPTC